MSFSAACHRAVALILVASAAWASPAAAQRADSSRVAAGAARTTVPSADSVVAKAPLTPRRAFVYSLLLPGYSQWVLGRPTAGAVFVTAEAITLTMVRESRSNLRDARRFRSDSIVVQYVDPVTGSPALKRERAQADSDLVRVRRSQVEDWLAALIATHLFSGLDALVAAHLWDVPTRLSVNPGGRTATVAARLSF